MSCLIGAWKKKGEKKKPDMQNKIITQLCYAKPDNMEDVISDHDALQRYWNWFWFLKQLSWICMPLIRILCNFERTVSQLPKYSNPHYTHHQISHSQTDSIYLCSHPLCYSLFFHRIWDLVVCVMPICFLCPPLCKTIWQLSFTSWLTSLNHLQIHPCCLQRHDFIFFISGFYWEYVPQLL